MEPRKKILLSLPVSVADALCRLSERSSLSRSELIRRILADYVKDAAHRELAEQMRSGYRKMGAVNLRLAEEALTTDAEQIISYEQFLSECE